ncbi:MAG: multicopper oxidase domain-containing protein [Chloroflexota bacterium]
MDAVSGINDKHIRRKTMFNRKSFAIMALVLLIASLLLGGSSRVSAQGGGPPPPKDKKDKITHNDRKAAAERAQALGFTLEALGQATMAVPGAAPRYFSHPNYANSPLRLPDALVELVGDGTGAAASAIVDPLTGAITSITLDAGGSGYTVAPTVVFSSTVVTTGSGAAATATISGTVTNLTLDSGGLGYTEPITVEFSGGGGAGAAATANVTPIGFVSGINVTNPGSGYTAATVDITGDGAGATAVASLSGPVTAITLVNGGLGYTAPVVEISGDGTGALASATVTPVGFVSGINVTNPGSGYTAATVDITGDGAGATAVASLSGPVTAITLVNGGSGYTAPVVEISGDGTGALASATVTPVNFVSGINVTNGGAGYTTATVDIVGDGTGATAEATIDANGAISAIMVTSGGAGYTTAAVTINGDGTGATAEAVLDTTSGPITDIALTNGGAGYTSAAVLITDATGTGADATAAVSMGVSAITVTNGGAGYTTAVVAISGDGTGATAEAVLDTVSGPITDIALTNGGAGYTSAAVLITDATGTGADATAAVTMGVSAITVTNGGAGYTTAAVAISGDGTGATADAVVDTTSGPITALTLTDGGAGYSSAPAVTFIGGAGSGAVATATISGTVTALTLDSGGSGYVTPGLRKFVDGLAGLGPSGANNLGQYISVAVPDTTTYPGSDYYEIAVVQYQEQMHSDLPPTTLRGYVQLETPVIQGSHYDLGNGYFSVDAPHYLGATIVAQKDRPVRVKFYNLLPTGQDGNLFIPVDTTVMGAGMGSDMFDPATGEMMAEPDPQNPMCGMTPKPASCFPENRATLHLHGGISPWISDGTPHQWVTPANENTPYPQGVSVVPVPDMGDSGNPNDGVMTFYYTNQQSARLMFYHDHSWGITRLNVYAGEAAGYLLTDSTEQALLDSGVIPAEQIPLVIQDKTFVPPVSQLAMQDETWDIAMWGGEGSLWMPHVYSPAQNPGDASGVNQFGRWAYGPWFWPPTQNVEFGPVDNPYFDPACNPDLQWCEPSLMPGTPFLSMGMEAFNDTPMVNGTVYPTLTLDPKSYRFRILSVANDRFFNLSFYRAVDANGVVCDAANTNPAQESTGVACTEVALNPVEVAAALDDPAGVFPTPLAGTEGPAWLQIGTEGGFLPAPVVIPAHVTTWVTDPTVFNAGNVDQHSLLLGPAERADVIVDFSQYAGQTLILYNDAPAAFPARDPRYDYYTGNPDLSDTGGAPSTLAGYGPNTRTVMQIKINAAPAAPAFDLAALQAAFAHHADGSGVFESGQNPIIVGQGAYNNAYGTAFQSNGPFAGLVQIYDTSLTFDTLSGNRLAMSLRPKMIQDEMGEAFEHAYGRMSGLLGVETPNAQAGLQNMILMPYVSPPVEVLDGVDVGGTAYSLEVTPIASADDGTQIWKITHNGVDTHPIHWHLYEVQLLNRVGWDGIIRKPDLNELGWKDTVRISPLEDTIVALRPIVPHAPFDLPNSIRLIDPSLPEGAYIANTTQQEALGLPIFAFNPNGEPIDIINHFVNYGWEYVWHCHILSHEEMDMMHSQVVGIAPAAPTGLTWVPTGNGNNTRNVLTWTDNSKNETAFVIERSSSPTGPWSTLATVPSDRLVVGPGTGQRTYTDRVGRNTYYYQVYAINTVGDTWDYSDPAFNEIPPGGGFPTLTLDSRGGTVSAIAAPSNLTASAVQKNNKTATVTLNWTDNAANETGFLIQRADNAGFSLGVVNATVGADITTFSQNVGRGKTFYYRVLAFNDTLSSGWSNTASVTTP